MVGVGALGRALVEVVLAKTSVENHRVVEVVPAKTSVEASQGEV